MLKYDLLSIFILSHNNPALKEVILYNPKNDFKLKVISGDKIMSWIWLNSFSFVELQITPSSISWIEPKYGSDAQIFLFLSKHVKR